MAIKWPNPPRAKMADWYQAGIVRTYVWQTFYATFTDEYYFLCAQQKCTLKPSNVWYQSLKSS